MVDDHENLATWPSSADLTPPFRCHPAVENSRRLPHNSSASGAALVLIRRWFEAFSLATAFLVGMSSMGVARKTGFIFVSNEKTNNLLVIDPRTYQVVKDIRTSRRPRDMHFSADHDKLYVACGDDDVIDIIDVAKLEVVGKLSTGTSPETFGIDEKRRRIYVSNEEASSLSVIDMDQNITIHEVPTGAEPEGVLIGEDGHTVYVTSEVGDLVHLVNADTGNVEQDVVVGTRPRRFAATPDGKELWVSTELSGEVYVIDRETFTVKGKIEFLPPGMRKSDVTPVDLRITRDGKTAYVTLGHAAHVAVVDVPSRKVEGYILVGKRAWGLGMSRDENTLYVANGFGDDITVIDLKSRKATVSLPVGRIPWGIVIDD
jgi:PQQ-dependent catabolism-associated beta-propeller protein